MGLDINTTIRKLKKAYGHPKKATRYNGNMMTKLSITHWVETEWSRSTVLIVPILLLLSPLLYAQLGPLFWTFFQLPIYMIHQYEEHAHGAFKAYINKMLGKNAITDLDIAKINIGEIWLLFIILLLLAVYIAPGFGLIPVYLVLFNAITHIAMAIRRREYNPGLWTSLGLFLPISIGSVLSIQSALALPTWQHIIALFLVVGVHADLILRIRRNIRNRA